MNGPLPKEPAMNFGTAIIRWIEQQQARLAEIGYEYRYDRKTDEGQIVLVDPDKAPLAGWLLRNQ